MTFLVMSTTRLKGIFMTRNAAVIAVSLLASAETRLSVSWDIAQPGTLLPTRPISGGQVSRD